MIDNKAWNTRNVGMNSGSHFIHLEEGFIKLNFNGASKGNPREAGLRGLFRETRTNTCLIYAESCGISSNSEVEFAAVRQNLLIAVRMGYINLEVVGDSSLVINTMVKLNNGTKWDKLS